MVHLADISKILAYVWSSALSLTTDSSNFIDIAKLDTFIVFA